LPDTGAHDFTLSLVPFFRWFSDCKTVGFRFVRPLEVPADPEELSRYWNLSTECDPAENPGGVTHFGLLFWIGDSSPIGNGPTVQQ
jgi:hypothetical protein